MKELFEYLQQLIAYLGQYNFGQKLVLIVVVPLTVTLCLKILHPTKVGPVEFEDDHEKPPVKRKIFHKKGTR